MRKSLLWDISAAYESRTPSARCRMPRPHSWVHPWASDLVVGAAALPSAREIFHAELRLRQAARSRLGEHPACCPDEMHIHAPRDDISTEDELVVQRKQRHRPARNLEPAVNAGQSLHVELFHDAGRDLMTRSSQVTGACAVRYGEGKNDGSCPRSCRDASAPYSCSHSRSRMVNGGLC